MSSSYLENVPNVPTACIGRTNSIVPRGQVHFARAFSEFKDCFRLRIEPMHMHRNMVLRISDKSNSLEPYGAHGS